jgi:hypothetical protein
VCGRDEPVRMTCLLREALDRESKIMTESKKPEATFNPFIFRFNVELAYLQEEVEAVKLQIANAKPGQLAEVLRWNVSDLMSLDYKYTEVLSLSRKFNIGLDAGEESVAEICELMLKHLIQALLTWTPEQSTNNLSVHAHEQHREGIRFALKVLGTTMMLQGVKSDILPLLINSIL